MYDYATLVPRLSPCMNYRFSVLQAMKSWAGPGNKAGTVIRINTYDCTGTNLPLLSHCQSSHR